MASPVHIGDNVYTKTDTNMHAEADSDSATIAIVYQYIDLKLEGEDEESNDVNAFCNKKPWQRFIVLVSGALMNFVLGFLYLN